MRTFSTTIEIGASPEQVWRVMSDVERWHEWTASITSVTPTSAGPFGLGSTADVKQPKLAKAHFVVTAWDPPRGFDWVAKNPAVTALGRHWIERTATGARVRLAVEFSGPLAAVIAWLYGGLTTRYVRMEAEGLKRRVETAPEP
jgi:uncharacterized protein YndB with AHSA1/START domain